MPRPRKPDRHPTMVRMPYPLKARIDRARIAAGYDNTGEFLVDVIAAAEEAGLWPSAVPILPGHERLSA